MSSTRVMFAGVFAAVVLVIPCGAGRAPIVIDSVFDDWSGVAVALQDAAGDGGANGVDFGRLWIADDDRFLFLRFELGAEVDPSENNDIRIYLDTDDDRLTGLRIKGIGAELEWRMGGRFGKFFLGAGPTAVFQQNIRFRGAPTVTGNVFEIAFGRDTLPDGANPLFMASTLKILIVDADGGDRMPDAGLTLDYTLDQGSLPPETTIPLTRRDPGHLRLVTHNVLFDSPWNPALEASFGRQYAAIAADIFNFQEVSSHTAAEAAALVAAWVPLGAGESWHSAGNADCKTVSRFPILGSWPIDGNLAVWVDTSAVLGRAMLIVNAHLPCCSNDAGREREIDNILAFIREARQSGGVLALDPNTPIYVTGDLNLVGFAQQLTSLLTGNVLDEATYGPDFAPDWDGSDLTSLISRQTEKRMGYTWRSDSSSFWPGHLDFVIYTDSVLEAQNHFILYTPEMSGSNLAANGLQSGDSTASDHLPVCADFRRKSKLAGDVDGDCDIDLIDLVRLLTNFGASGGMTRSDGDTDGDGDVDLTDLAVLLRNFGATCN